MTDTDPYDGMGPAQLIDCLAALNGALARRGVAPLLTETEALAGRLYRDQLVQICRDTAAELTSKGHQLRGLW